jgi:hypothetical protein
MIRAFRINQILLQRHVDSLQAQSNRIQKWVIALAVAALVGTVVQTAATVIQTSIAIDEQKAKTPAVILPIESRAPAKIEPPSTPQPKG